MLPIDDVIHLGIIGISQGCAYGLIALGFVLIYKATEVVNFAHGEFMMLGAFAVLSISEATGWGFWPSFVLGCLSIGVVGYLIVAVAVFCGSKPCTQISGKTLAHLSAAALDSLDSCQIIVHDETNGQKP